MSWVTTSPDHRAASIKKGAGVQSMAERCTPASPDWRTSGEFKRLAGAPFWAGGVTSAPAALPAEELAGDLDNA